MAKMLPCYSLCPLIEQKSFLGLTSDGEQDTVIVTANSNIIGRYRVSDPKQITSWNSKGSISSAAVYDKLHETYVGVFNQNEIRQWSISEESIDRVKKYKFAEKISGLAVTPDQGKTIIVFQSGYASYLDAALDKRKSTFEGARLTETERIISYEVLSFNGAVIICVLISDDNSYRLAGIKPDENNLMFNYKFQKAGKLLGYCLLNDKYLECVTVWSDGKLFRNGVSQEGNKKMKHLNTFTDIENQHQVALKTLSPYSVAICYVKNDGLMLLVYSVKYNLTHCKQFFDNCTNSPQLWYLDTKLFLIIGYNLVVVPYMQENRKLSTLVGTNTENVDDRNNDVISETEICQKQVPQLIEENDTSGIINLVSGYRDIPDSAVVELLLWCLKKKKSRRSILQLILSNFTVSDASLLQNTVQVDMSLELLEFAIGEISRIDDNSKMVSWATVIVDAFYQQYMTSSDEKVLEKLNSYLGELKKECDRLDELKKVAAVASCVKRKKVILSK